MKKKPTRTRVTKAMITKAVKRGACGFAVGWLRAKPRTIEGLVHHNRDWAEWAIISLGSLSQVRKFHQSCDVLGRRFRESGGIFSSKIALYRRDRAALQISALKRIMK